MEADLYYMRLVAGTGQVEELVTGRVSLPVPAEEILEWRKHIELHRAEALCGGIVLTGVVRSRCLFAAPETDGQSRVLTHVAEIWFRLHLPLPEAADTMQVVVTDAFVAGDSSRPIAWNRTGGITALLDRSLVVIGVRVIRPEIVQKPFPNGGRERVPQAPRKKRRPSGPKRPRKRREPRPGPAPPSSQSAPESRPAGPWVHPSAAVPGRASAKKEQDTTRS